MNMHVRFRPFDRNSSSFRPTVLDLSRWLESQNPHTLYEYSSRNCLLAQYLKARGYKGIVVGSADWYYKCSGGSMVKRPLNSIVDGIAAGVPRTFGGALDRCYEALKMQQWRRKTTLSKESVPS